MVRQQRPGNPGEDDGRGTPLSDCGDSDREYATKSADFASLDVMKKMYSALVWSPAPDTHGKAPGLSSKMFDHVPTSPHDPVHYFFNGVENTMNTSDQHNASAMHKAKEQYWNNLAAVNGSSLLPESQNPKRNRHIQDCKTLNSSPGGSLEEGRGGGGMDSSQMHSLYGSHGNRANSTSSGSPPVSTPSSSGSMLVVPQPISAASKGPGAPSGVVATNGTGRKYQCKMCPQLTQKYTEAGPAFMNQI